MKFIILPFLLLLSLIFITFIFNNFNSFNSQPTLEVAESIIKTCSKSPDWRDCYGTQLSSFNKDYNLQKSIKLLNLIQDIDPKVRDCHLISHYLASSEVEKTPDKWLEVFNFVDQTTCNNGFVHGTLEGKSRFDHSFELNASVIPGICQAIEKKTSKRLGIKAKSSSDDACSHILGHILLAQNYGDIEKTVTECDKLASDYKLSCLQGTFMENITRENLVIHGVDTLLPTTLESADKINSLCKAQTGDGQKACFREITHLYTLITKSDPLKVFEFCHKALTEEEGRECYFHGINLMVLSENFSNTQLNNLCIPYIDNENVLKNCIIRTLSPLIGSSVKYITRSLDFCNEIPQPQKQFCYSAIGKLLKPKAPESERVNLCQNAPAEFKKACSGEF